MINKTEIEIKKNWPAYYEKPVVSVICIAYNHESFISDALDGFLMQETDFPFEIVVHDDASTDNTQSIIQEYAKLFPSIVRPVLEKNNLYSKRDGSLGNALENSVKTDYVAFCEGDDCWIDPDKLQSQYHYITTHPECSMVVHNTVLHDLDRPSGDTLFNNWTEIHQLEPKDAFSGWTVHFSSYFLRTEAYKEIRRKPQRPNYWFTDYKMLTWAMYLGNVVCLPAVMSQYNFNNKNGITYNNSILKADKYKERMLARADYLKEYDVLTDYCFHEAVNERINHITQNEIHL